MKYTEYGYVLLLVLFALINYATCISNVLQDGVIAQAREYNELKQVVDGLILLSPERSGVSLLKKVKEIIEKSEKEGDYSTVESAFFFTTLIAALGEGLKNLDKNHSMLPDDQLSVLVKKLQKYYRFAHNSLKVYQKELLKPVMVKEPSSLVDRLLLSNALWVDQRPHDQATDALLKLSSFMASLVVADTLAVNQGFTMRNGGTINGDLVVGQDLSIAGDFRVNTGKFAVRGDSGSVRMVGPLAINNTIFSRNTVVEQDLVLGGNINSRGKIEGRFMRAEEMIVEDKIVAKRGLFSQVSLREASVENSLAAKQGNFSTITTRLLKTKELTVDEKIQANKAIFSQLNSSRVTSSQVSSSQINSSQVRTGTLNAKEMTIEEKLQAKQGTFSQLITRLLKTKEAIIEEKLRAKQGLLSQLHCTEQNSPFKIEFDAHIGKKSSHFSVSFSNLFRTTPLVIALVTVGGKQFGCIIHDGFVMGKVAKVTRLAADGFAIRSLQGPTNFAVTYVALGR